MRLWWIMTGICTGISSFAAETDWRNLLRNDKEAVSRVCCSRSGLRRAAERMADREGPAFDRLVSVLQDQAPESGAPPTDEGLYAELIRSLKQSGIEDPSEALPDLLKLWRSKDRVDDVFAGILSRGGKGLTRYLGIVRRVKNRSIQAPSGAGELLPNRFSSSWKNRRRRLTRRGDLYGRFNSYQILLLGDVLRHLFERMEAGRARLVFSRQDHDDSIELSPMGQYYFARRLLLKEMQELNASAWFAGNPFSYEEVVTAALETGLVNGKMLNEVMAIDDLWNPAVAPWEKIGSYALRITGGSTVFLPPPFNVVGALAFVIIQSVIENPARHRGQGRDGYDPF